MNKIIQYRAQEQMCRQRAVFDLKRKHYWLGKAEMWWHKAQDEITSHFAECGSGENVIAPGTRRAKPSVHV
jgi:hypothetical protein